MYIYSCNFDKKKFKYIFELYGHAFYIYIGGGEIAQSLASLSVKRAVQVCAQLDLLVTER